MSQVEQKRRSILQALNSKFIYGRVPLLHSIIFLLQMAAVSLLIQKFNSAYGKKPLLTSMITNAILGGIADTVAQTLTSFQKRKAQRELAKNDIGVEIADLDEKHEHKDDMFKDSRPPPFDFERLTRFMSFGFLNAVIQYKWYGFLSRALPVTKVSATVPALKRVALDQFVMAPIGLALFFVFMTVAEGGGKRAVMRKFQDVYIFALKANYVLWPAVQFINFRFVPLQIQLPFVSTIGIAWTAYLSLTNSAEDE